MIKSYNIFLYFFIIDDLPEIFSTIIYSGKNQIQLDSNIFDPLGRFQGLFHSNRRKIRIKTFFHENFGFFFTNFEKTLKSGTMLKNHLK